MPSPFRIMSNTRSAINKKAKDASHKSPATMPVLTRPALNSSNPHLLSWPPTQLRIRPAAMAGPDDGDDEDSDPSPDVWSIEEEPEREACELAAADAAGKAAVMDKPVKAKKKVRFVLPVKED
ncbi:hypothetical protein MAPG_11252 [Magnaporthiopsis poae ATCC 64411]|uniref:Uncharacterized protein n=1 Tax=Magnaporthiopsis poae (strain ATCC 64411 / 73-15) TaxID=644358 RepID=A0A0C4EES3_MAGP6|nr:hypothetical protein MAPG_11252 [Magnaporthiopsis poae ATCC 64411]